MASETQVEPSASLIDAAEVAGYSLTEDRLARWHRQGLLPSPSVKHLGKGRGTTSLYPSGTTRQLLDLLSIRQKHRSLVEVGFRLWLAGYPVSDRYSFDYLGEVAEQHDRIICTLKAARDRILSDDEKVQDEAWAEIDQFAKKRIELKFVRRIRKRVSVGKFETFIRLLLDIATGEFRGFEKEHDDESGEYDDSILRSALGINSIQARLLNGSLLWLKDPIESVFIDLSRMFASSEFTDVLHSTQRNCIDDAREEFWILLSGISVIAAGFENLFGKKIPAFNGIREIYELANARDLAWMLIAWCQMRHLPWAQDYPKILDALREAGFAPRSAKGESHD